MKHRTLAIAINPAAKLRLLLLAAAALAAALLCSAHAANNALISAASAQAINYGNKETVRILKISMPLHLTAKDMMSKVYGCLDCNLSRHDLMREAKRHINLTPSCDEYGYWLENNNGYKVQYAGLTPEVSAVAIYDKDNKDHLATYCFFFLFPYAKGEREMAIDEQSDFCGCLLQEMHDMGLDIYTAENSDALVDAVTQYNQNLVEVRLIEEAISPSSQADEGRFLIVLRVEPDAFSPSDNIQAYLNSK